MSALAWVAVGLGAWFAVAVAIAVPVGRRLRRQQPPEEGEEHR